MKNDIHPAYGPATIRCACGNVIETCSTSEGTVQVEICSACHPFFTGKQKLMDIAGRIDRFKKKYGEKVVLGTQKRQNFAPPPAPAKKIVVDKNAPVKGAAKDANKEKLQQAKEKFSKKA